MISKVTLKITQAPNQVQEAFDDVSRRKRMSCEYVMKPSLYGNGIIP